MKDSRSAYNKQVRAYKHKISHAAEGLQMVAIYSRSRLKDFKQMPVNIVHGRGDPSGCQYICKAAHENVHTRKCAPDGVRWKCQCATWCCTAAIRPLRLTCPKNSLPYSCAVYTSYDFPPSESPCIRGDAWRHSRATLSIWPRCLASSEVVQFATPLHGLCVRTSFCRIVHPTDGGPCTK